jgi:ribosomal protein S27AE
LIEHQCPQCGAPAIMEETDRLFTCEFCRVKSYLVAQDAFRYLLPSRAPESKDLLFFPYWRFKGMLFSCAATGWVHKFVDVSQQAIISNLFPASLGLRSQALKLKFIKPEAKGYFFKPTQSFEQVVHNFETRFDKSLSKPVLHRAHIGETISLIYAPFYIQKRLYDAVLDRPVTASASDLSEIEQLAAESPDGSIHFMATLCPHCGWDLDGERDSLVLLCKNCTSAWHPFGEKLKKIRFGTLPNDDSDAIYLPFWRIQPEISGLNLTNYADLIHVANIPRVIQPGWENIDFQFWVPAFKVRPKIFLRLSTNLTLSQLQNQLDEKLPERRHHPITLPVTEAIESLKVNLASFLKPKTRLADIRPGIEIAAKSVVLVYVPFHEKHHELIQPDIQFAINKNIVALSENL